MEGTSKFKAQAATEAIKEREILTEPVSNEKRIRRLIRIKAL
jgi:putative transposase